MGSSVTQIWTIGHSTLPMPEFIAVLTTHQIAVVADVRTYPGSRRYPQFNRAELRESLAASGIDYLHIPELGGRRRPRSDSPNTAWRIAGFRGYADHMETELFASGVRRLLEPAVGRRLAIM